MENKVVLYLMNEKGYGVLNNIVEIFGGDIIKYIVIARDKNLDNDFYDTYISFCNEKDIRCFDRKDSIPAYRGYKIAIGWRWIISDDENLIVTHDSLLPKYRGYAPLVNMLINGEDHIGVTTFFANKEFDKGNIISQKKLPINYPIKISEAIKIIIPLFYSSIHEFLLMVKNGEKIVGIEQDENEASYGLWRDEEDYFIDWNTDSDTIKRFVDAVGSPYGKARAYLNKELVIIEDVEVYPEVTIETDRSVGKVLFVDDQMPVIVCSKGLIKIINGYYTNGSSIIPLNKYRSRFT